jgi:hypothetical protein
LTTKNGSTERRNTTTSLPCRGGNAEHQKISSIARNRNYKRIANFVQAAILAFIGEAVQPPELPAARTRSYISVPCKGTEKDRERYTREALARGYSTVSDFVLDAIVAFSGADWAALEALDSFFAQSVSSKKREGD